MSSIRYEIKEIYKFKYVDDVIPMQPEVPFSTTTVKNLKWFGRELTELWKEKSNDKERWFIYLAIDPKCQGDLQSHMIFYMTSKLYGLSRSLWPICDSIQHILREISAIESIMTSCLLNRKCHKVYFYEIKVIIILLILKQVWPRSEVNNGDILIWI